MKVRFLRDRKGKVDRRYVIAEDGSYIRDKKTGEKLDDGIYELQGYRKISITVNGKRYSSIKICHLQWLAWKGVIPRGFQIHHIDENKLNDHKDNLACLSKSEHMSSHKIGNKNWLGKHHTEEWKQKRSKDMSGEKNSMFGRTGEKNPMWGRTGEKNPRSTLKKLPS